MPETDARTQRDQYEQIARRLKTERSGFDAVWRELGDFVLPSRLRSSVTERNKDRRSPNIINSAACFALRTLQSGLHAGLTSPARPWFRLSTPDPDLAEQTNVKLWLHDVTQRMLNVFLKSNLYNALPIVYGDMGGFGTSAVGIMEDDQTLFRCYPYPIGSYAFGLDKRGISTTFVREYSLTVRQLVEEFGMVEGNPKNIDWTRFSQRVRDLWDRSQYEDVIDVCWIVLPNDEYRPHALGSKYLRWKSCHFERGGQSEDATGMLRESGYRQFPVLTPRWGVTAEDTYGTDCPGMLARGDIKSLQVLEKKIAKAVDKQIDPPLVAPMSLRTQKVSLLPGDLTFADERDGHKGLRAVHEVNFNLDHAANRADRIERRINDAFYANLFLMLASSDPSQTGQPVTAREIQERHEEKLLAIGPVLERTNDELLDPLVDRVFDLMDRAGLIPPAPEELDGVELKVEYESLMAQAQKLVGAAALDRFVQSMIPISQAFPETRHKLNLFQIVDDFGDVLGVNPALVKSDEDAQASLEAEQQAMQQAQQAEQFKMAAQGAQQLGNTPMDGDSALNRLLGVPA